MNLFQISFAILEIFHEKKILNRIMNIKEKWGCIMDEILYLYTKFHRFFEFPSCLTFLVSGTRLRPALFHPWPAQGFSPSRTHFERRRDWSPRMQVRYEASLFQARPSDPVFTRVAVRHSRGPCHALIFHFCDSSVARGWNGPAQTKLADHVTNDARLLSLELMQTTEYVWRVRPMRFP